MNMHTISSKGYEKISCEVHAAYEKVGTESMSKVRLRDLRKANNNSTKSLSGRGKLTEKVINTLLNYFGMAIRDNKGNLHQMKKAVGAVLWQFLIKYANLRIIMQIFGAMKLKISIYKEILLFAMLSTE